MCSYGRVYCMEEIDLSPCFLVSWSMCAGVTRLKGFTACSSQEWDLVVVRQFYLLAKETENSHPKPLAPWRGWPHCTEWWSLFTRPPLMLSHGGKGVQGSPGFPYDLHFYCKGVLLLARGGGSLNSLLDTLRHHPCRDVKSPLYGLVREEE